MSPVASYRRLLALAGPTYVAIAFVGRLPLAMSQLGTLLLVAQSTGSYAAGGFAAGALAVVNAVTSPLAGGLADRHGQRPVVLVQSLLGGVGLLTMVALAHAGASGSTLALVAAVTGAALPQIGPLARVRWRPLTGRAGAGHAHLVTAAFSYEGAADEATFVLGPALIGLAITVASPGAALVVAALLLVVFGSGFALHPTATLAHAARVRQVAGARLVTPLLAGLLLAQALIGMLFGSVQAGNGLLATAVGQPGLAGLVHAVLGVGSVTAGLAMAAVPERVSLPTRTLVSAAALVLLSAPLLLVDSLAASAWVMLALGFAVAPYMISNFTLAERTAAPSRVAATMTVLAGATGIGYAVGATVAGRLADVHGHTAAFAVTLAACGAALVLASAMHPAARRTGRPVWRRSPFRAEPESS